MEFAQYNSINIFVIIIVIIVITVTITIVIIIVIVIPKHDRALKSIHTRGHVASLAGGGGGVTYYMRFNCFVFVCHKARTK